MPAAPPLDRLPLATAVPAPLPPLDGYTFEGYRNADGSAGTRNILGIATTVQCVAPTVDYAVRRIKAELLPRFPECRRCRRGDPFLRLRRGHRRARRRHSHPHPAPHHRCTPTWRARPLMVSLGCEKLQPARLLGPMQLPDPGRRRNVIRLQDQRGFAEIVVGHHGSRRAAPGAALTARRRVTCPASDLVVGLQCGGSDAFSGVTCNPAVGYAADLLVRAGATVMFSEVTEVRDAIHLLTPRAATPEVAPRPDPRDALVRRLPGARRRRPQRQYHARQQARRAGQHRREGAGQRGQGRAARAIAAVATHGEKVTAKGLVFAATPASDFICGTQQLASMNLHVFTTGEGSPYGLALVPVVKVSSRTALAEKWHDLIDIDAGRIATGQATIEEVGWELFRFILEVASGRRRTWAEHWGLGNALAPFNPGPVT